jgi:hypothetical protein
VNILDEELVKSIVNYLDTAEDELILALSTGSDANRDFYIKNAMKFIREVMEMLE